MRETNSSRDRPVDDASDECARLGEEGQLAGQGAGKSECRVEPDPRNGNAEAIWADDAQAIRLCRIEHRLLLFGGEPSGDGHDGSRSLGAELSHDLRHRLGWRCDHGNLRRFWQCGDRVKAGLARDFLVVGIDQKHFVRETGVKHVLGQDIADRALLRRRADHRHRPWGKSMFEIANRHIRRAKESRRARSSPTRERANDIPPAALSSHHSIGCTMATRNVRSMSPCSLFRRDFVSLRALR
jgi:hypothetical protein